LVDEIVTVFEADDFHAGMDEVFYIGDEQNNVPGVAAGIKPNYLQER